MLWTPLGGGCVLRGGQTAAASDFFTPFRERRQYEQQLRCLVAISRALTPIDKKERPMRRYSLRVLGRVLAPGEFRVERTGPGTGGASRLPRSPDPDHRSGRAWRWSRHDLPVYR